MTYLKPYFANLLKGKTVHFVVDCIVKLDVTGEIIGYEMQGSEIVFHVKVGNKVVKVGENTNKLQFEVI